MNTSHQTNPWLQLSADFVLHTGQSVFLTGKAGTGKTTFLKTLRETCPKQMAVLAPTGVAAINAGGSTIHSFLQLPFGPFIPVKHTSQEGVSGQHSLVSRIRFNKEKRELLQSLELLVIDEVSMVRADLMDAIDTVLRYFRKNDQPFGGLQMLFIGDMYQLPPVVNDTDWTILQDYYTGPFFFDSQVIRQQPPVYIELQTIYRQTDEQFVNLLNQVRNSNLTREGLELLNRRVQRDFVPPAHTNYITLTTHNAKADEINQRKLDALARKAYTYKATVEGEFKASNFPAEEKLVLKEGAQVMFLKNDVQGKKYYNGKIGVVSKLDEKELWVECEGDRYPIQVKPEVWRNVQYTLNKQAQQVEEKEIGSFTQYPIRLAWAVTIHKSQGLTFQHAIIDAASSFSSGQVYVALSRCTSLEGMVLMQPIPPSAVITNNRISEFAATGKHLPELEAYLQQSRRQFQWQMLMQLFTITHFQTHVQSLDALLNQHAQSYGDKAADWIKEVKTVIEELNATAQKFVAQLQQYQTKNQTLPANDEWVQQRVRQAAAWFIDQLDTRLLPRIKKHPVVTDSKEQADDFEEELARLFVGAKQAHQLLSVCKTGFDPEQLLRARSKVNITEITGYAYAGSSRRKDFTGTKYPELYARLKALRDSLAEQEGKPIFYIANSSTLLHMSDYLPQTPDQLLCIAGFGPQKLKQYGDKFLDVIKSFAEELGLEPDLEHLQMPRRKKEKLADDKTPKEKKIPTQVISYELWQQGMSISDIARERNLQPATIEGHLVPYMLQGLIARNQLISDELFEKIMQVFTELETDVLGEVKQVLGDEASYGQIRLVLDWMRKEGMEWQNAKVNG